MGPTHMGVEQTVGHIGIPVDLGNERPFGRKSALVPDPVQEGYGETLSVEHAVEVKEMDL